MIMAASSSSSSSSSSWGQRVDRREPGDSRTRFRLNVHAGRSETLAYMYGVRPKKRAHVVNDRDALPREIASPSPDWFRRGDDPSRRLRAYALTVRRARDVKSCRRCRTTYCRNVAPNLELADFTCLPMLEAWTRLARLDTPRLLDFVLQCARFLHCERCLCERCGDATAEDRAVEDSADLASSVDPYLGLSARIHEQLVSWHTASIGLTMSWLFEQGCIDTALHSERIFAVFRKLVAAGNLCLALPFGLHVNRQRVCDTLQRFAETHSDERGEKPEDRINVVASRYDDCGKAEFCRRGVAGFDAPECSCIRGATSAKTVLAIHMLALAHDIRIKWCERLPDAILAARADTRAIVRRCFAERTHGLQGFALGRIFAEFGAGDLAGVATNFPRAYSDTLRRCVRHLSARLYVNEFLLNDDSPLLYEPIVAIECKPISLSVERKRRSLARGAKGGRERAKQKPNTL